MSLDMDLTTKMAAFVKLTNISKENIWISYWLSLWTKLAQNICAFGSDIGLCYGTTDEKGSVFFNWDSDWIEIHLVEKYLGINKIFLNWTWKCSSKRMHWDFLWSMTTNELMTSHAVSAGSSRELSW